MHEAATPRPLRIVKRASSPPAILHVPKHRRTRATSVPSTTAPRSNDSRPRAVTVGSMQNDLPKSSSYRSGTLKSSETQPSLRHRLLTRVMSGVSNKSQVSHAAMEREAIHRQLHGSHIGRTEAARDVEEVGRPRPSTASSIDTISTLGGNLEHALAAFPTPPTSTVTSPTTLSSFETSRTLPMSPRRLVQPPNNAIPGAELTLIPEIDQLSLDAGKSVFVAIEVTGTVGSMDWSSETPARPRALDVAVVIDST